MLLQASFFIVLRTGKRMNKRKAQTLVSSVILCYEYTSSYYHGLDLSKSHYLVKIIMINNNPLKMQTWPKMLDMKHNIRAIQNAMIFFVPLSACLRRDSKRKHFTSEIHFTYIFLYIMVTKLINPHSCFLNHNKPFFIAKFYVQ